ncbi:MAG: D-aminoacyl-tRNA deacylase [Coriobacteriales bacterium]|jgi:D-tyrosyl-tRNA(Tyr) deacylase
MRALVQRVTRASVSVEGRSVGSIGHGMVVLLGVARDDTEERAGKLWRKLRDLRMFDDERGRADLTLADVGGSVLVVSQFTLYASVRRGRRPSYSDAAPGPQASALYEAFCALVRADLGDVQTGVFGADMQVSLVNDGPYTIWVDTDDLA